ncbi:CPBP family intramembrane glutamic endopeptidase [Natrialba swarupiae]|uniref:CPBP family intramembrane metalloprotease n=1 Tax=Natrialba swarupiae TaxID=2448032 RepID=A0A5D5AUZ0_9EURY|nr:type II CAAX endopeptidase family protein [Natrialba swarupiae]TYT62911.1 CPBP family intramembrane metalloprotease [Natrialba swarupiae]
MSDQPIDRSTEVESVDDHPRALGRLKRTVARSPVVAFVLFAFGYTWAIDAIALLAFEGPSELHSVPRAWGPLVAGGVVVWLLDEDVRSYVGQVKHVRVGIHWYAIGVAIPLLLTDSETLVALAFGATIGFEPTAPLVLYLVNFLVVLFLAGGLEEFGWRGFAQPRLQEPHSAVVVAVLVGILWASWHLPLFLLYDLPAYDPATLHSYYLTTILWAIVLAWLYNSTGGGLLVVIIAHAAGNLPPFLAVTGETPELVATLPIRELTYLVVALVIVGYAGPRTLSRDGELPPVAGRKSTDSDRSSSS